VLAVVVADEKMVERVARALVESFNHSNNYGTLVEVTAWDDLSEKQRAFAFEQACAATTAMKNLD
jgi:hypothetical protein